MIEIKNLTKQFKNECLYEDINIQIKEGERVLIVGDNGSGKSVLMKLMVGFSQPTYGEVWVDGYKLGDRYDFIQDAGVSINQAEFINHLSGLENLEILANYKKISDKSRILELAEKLYFEKDILKPYKVFSLGMKQKMRFIQAMLDEPKYLILDEPFDALDAKSKKAMVEIIEGYLDDSKVLVYTTHNQDSQGLATRILTLLNEERTLEDRLV